MATFLLGTYIAIIFTRPMEWWGPVYGWRLVTFAAYATIVASFPSIANDHARMWRIVPQLRFALGLLAAATFSWVYPTWISGIIGTFTGFGKVMVLFYLVIVLGRQQNRFRMLLWTVLLCVAWMGVHGVLQHQRGFGFGGLEPLWREHSGVYQIVAFGIFDDPNDLCLVFVLAIPLLYAEFRAFTNPIFKIIAIGLIPLTVYAAWLTNSRGGVVGIFGMLAAYAIARTKGARRWIIAGAGIILVSVVAPSRFAKGLGAGGRLIPWGDGVTMWRQHPFLGVGYGAFGDYSSDSKVAHNSFIHVLAELGVAGYIPFFLIVYFTMLQMRRALKQRALLSRQDQAELSGLFSSAVGYLTSIYFLSRAYNHVLYVLLGLCIVKVLIVCRNPVVYQTVFGSYRQDLRRGVKWALASIPFFYISIKLGYLLGIG